MNSNIFDIFEKYQINNTKFNQKIINIKYDDFDAYSIFKGILLMYINIKDITPKTELFNNNSSKEILEINHCHDGTYAYQTENDNMVYFGKGDLCISLSNLEKTASDFPLGYYKGLEILIDVDLANDFISQYIPNFSLKEFYKKLSDKQGYILIRRNKQVDHIISEIYEVPEEIKETYFKLKIIELLLFFSVSELTPVKPTKISIKNVRIIKQIKNEITSDLSKNITIKELSEKYSISPTTLKKSFKEVYGKPLIKWRTEFKLDYAGTLLYEEKYSISEISKMIGYKNTSNFTKAFKKHTGYSPSEYKKIPI